MRTMLCLATGVVLGFGATAAAAAAESPYEVVWDSPSEDANGSVPLGNGEVALNAWVEPGGDLRFFLARTDSWDDNGRLLKVGGLRVRVGEGGAATTDGFRQTLAVKGGALSVRYGTGDARVDLRLWVDANRPLVCVEVQTATPTAVTVTLDLWRNEPETLPSVECSDIYGGRPEKTVVEPDTVLTGLTDRVGWYHRNSKSVGPELCAGIQGMAEFARPDPLLGRTFGALVAGTRPERPDDRTLRSAAGTRHAFEIVVHTRHPATADEWQAAATGILDTARAVPLAERWAAHAAWWTAFWQRSWIHIAPRAGQGGPAAAASPPAGGLIPANPLPVRIGMDQGGGSRFAGTLGRVSLYETSLADADVAALAALAAEAPAPAHPARVYSATPPGPTDLPDLRERTFATGLTLEAWLKPDIPVTHGGMRIIDKITVGGQDGFLMDIYPGRNLRVIVGGGTYGAAHALTPDQWQHVACTVTPKGLVRAFVNGKPVIAADAGAVTGTLVGGDDAAVVTRAYALQRYVAACAGRGRYPIKFNGSLFTVPAAGAPGHADYRRWGPGYWWQNTRLPYYAMCAAGDTEMMEPLFRMYVEDLLPSFVYRTRQYMGHDGAYIPECIYFWGDMFTETYGWQPCAERQDKLQASGWHKWEWVSGLELTGLALDRYEHTGDEAFLAATVLPLARQILTFFDRHYTTGADGKLVMTPSQALETWWECTNPMPEVAGLHAVTARLLALPEARTPAVDRAFWQQLRAKLPDLPTTRAADGTVMLAPAQAFARKQNCENPELYAVFPFRLFALDKPNREWAVAALDRRADRGSCGWRQDDVFMAWLGLADQARESLVTRARTKHAQSRFPAFWGPNYDWVPDQDHGSVLLKVTQSMLLQTDGRALHVLPAWPADWDCDFRLHAPFATTVSGTVTDGKLVRLDVQPADRRADVRLGSGW